MLNKSNHSKWMLVGSMVIFGTIGIFRKNIDLDSSLLAMARGVIGLIFLLCFLKLKKQKMSLSTIRANAPALFLSGLFLGVNWILLFEAYNHTTVAIATLCYYMAPVIVMLVSPFLLKEELTLKNIICAIVAVAGMVLISGITETGSSEGSIIGIAYGLAAAVFYAAVIITNKFIKDINTYDKTICQLGVSAVTLLPYVLAAGKLTVGKMSGYALLMLLIVGVVHTGIAYALYFGSMEGTPARTVALFGYIDPVVAIILSVLILHESMGIIEVVGMIFILCATAFNELSSP